MRDGSGACAAVALAADHQLPGDARCLYWPAPQPPALGGFRLMEAPPARMRDVRGTRRTCWMTAVAPSNQHAPQRLVARRA